MSNYNIFCKKCGNKLKEGIKFCSKCGAIVETKKEEPKEKESKQKKEPALKDKTEHTKEKGWNPSLILLCVLAFFLLIGTGILLPTKVVSYQVDVPYIDKEQYTVDVPYEDVEEYTVRVPYETEKTYIESIPYQEQEAYKTVECAFAGLFCGEVTKYRTVTKYKDVIKSKPATEYRDETRYRKVTKTRTETREREVRKTRAETKQKEVNWLFDFDAIIKFRNLN